MEHIKLMVAEDFDILREDMCEFLSKQEGYEVVGSAESGEKIKQLAEEIPCDIILMDIEMETINAGILAAEAIRDKNPEMNIIFLTAHETDDMIVTAMGTGAVDYIVKGVPNEKVLEHIAAVARGESLLERKIQTKIMNEYTRLRRSEYSLLFFINTVSKLTATERELVRLLLQGKKVKDISVIRCVEMVTVKTQIKGLLRKFHCTRTKEIVKMIEELNISNLF